MAYEEDLAERLRALLAGEPDLSERRMFGGMVMRNREMRGWLRVEPGGLEGREELAAWVARGVAFVRTLPPKE